MIGLDTNILVRYLTRDHEQQWRQAAAVIQQSQPCFITNIVLCELVWVLRGPTYSFRKSEHSPTDFGNASSLDHTTGSACTSGIEAPSHVLRAMGLSSPILDSALHPTATLLHQAV